MKLSNIEIHILNSLCDDYENVESIQGELFNAINEPIQAESMVEHLKKLSDFGLLDVYKYDVEKIVFNRQEDISNVDFMKSWFFITDEGRKELEKNWEGE
ncbi:MAG: hypothetical protein WAO19_13090 [Candidatus Kryptoniota bacterium]